MIARAARTAADAGIRGLKIYSMVGLPGEEDRDLHELAAMVLAIDHRLRITLAVQAFVPKPGTPLADRPMEDVRIIRRRLELLRGLLGRRATLSPTSARWSWLDWKLANGGERSALAAIEAAAGDGTFAAWKRGLSIAMEGAT